MTDIVDNRIRILERAIQQPERLSELIEEFQGIVWNTERETETPEWQVLSDLALDLEYYEPNPERRKEDKSFFAEERAINEIKIALSKFRAGS